MRHDLGVAALTDLLLVPTRRSARLDASGAPAGAATDPARPVRVSNFVTIQSLSTFAVAAAVLKTLWELTRALGGGWAESYWAATVLCLLYGAWQFALSASGLRDARKLDVASAAVVAVVNAGILAAAVIGLTETTNLG